jgi:hypothetical protein
VGIISVVGNFLATNATNLYYYFVVFGLAILAWGYRSLVEAEPDPFLLNLTLFAGIGQLIHEFEAVARHGHNVGPGVLVAGFATAFVIVFQIVVFRTQFELTRQHHLTLLEQHKISGTTKHDCEHWAEVTANIMGVDFYPEFYEEKVVLFDNSRAARRELAYQLIPDSSFNKASLTGGLSAKDLTVPQNTRRWPWRLHAVLCAAAWSVFLVSVLVLT